jgi:hypothetical protein
MELLCQSMILAERDHEEYDQLSTKRVSAHSKSMPVLRFPVAVVMQRTPLANRWVDERWEAVAVEIAEESNAPPERVEDSAPGTRWRCPGYFVELHPAEIEGYFLNASATEPTVFVLWRMAESEDAAEPRARPLIVTLSYGEAARFLDAGEQVDAVPIPPPLLAALSFFVTENYRPEPRKKVKRNELYEGDEARGREAAGGRER